MIRKTRWNDAVSTVLQESTLPGDMQARTSPQDITSSPLDSLDPSATYADHTDCYGDYGDAPAPAVPFFSSTGSSAASVPSCDIEMITALELLVEGLDAASHTISGYNKLGGLDNIIMSKPDLH